MSDRRAACPEIGSAYAAVSQTVARSPVDRSNRLLATVATRARWAGRVAQAANWDAGTVVWTARHKGTNVLSEDYLVDQVDHPLNLVNLC